MKFSFTWGGSVQQVERCPDCGAYVNDTRPCMCVTLGRKTAFDAAPSPAPVRYQPKLSMRGPLNANHSDECSCEHCLLPY